jgi:hypothetical protein
MNEDIGDLNDETTNVHHVHLRGGQIVIGALGHTRMGPDAALNLAAWLIIESEKVRGVGYHKIVLRAAEGSTL